MYLKSLEIQGFKSFPEKTVLEFGQEITAVVGPNGSGKSNISDAILWVMGEQSARGLRGQRMEDVIFGGTAKRRPTGFAQVTLVLDNTDRLFPDREESEVAVTRRYHRSGESEYQINRQSVRLRDVTELFLDTGMGREGYSIIGQGRIDAILSAKSGERRELFEEAAGISKFRHRKEEAERKLQKTAEDLLRIQDKIAELELQVEPLRDQAERAKRFLLLRDELRILEVSLWMDQLDREKTQARKRELDLRTAREQRDTLRSALEALYAAGEICSGRMQENDQAAERLRQEREALLQEMKEQERTAAVLESGLVHREEQLQQLQREQKETAQRKHDLASQIAAQEQRIQEIDRDRSQEEAALAACWDQLRETDQQAGGARNQAEALRQEEAAHRAAEAAEQVALAALEAERIQLSQRKEALEAECSGTRQQWEDAQRKTQQHRLDLEQTGEEAAQGENVLTGHRLRLEERQRKLEQAEETCQRLTLGLGAITQRLDLLREMEREYEGFSRAVRTVCQAQSALQGIHGPVASLLQTEAEYTLAVETALGAGLQNIVVDREEDAKAAIGFLKRKNAGRATFLPLNTLRGGEHSIQEVQTAPGVLGLASRLVRCEERYRGVIQHLLGHTVIVEDLDSGIALAQTTHHSLRIVTLDGQVLNRGGSITGGSASRQTGVLSRAAELESLGHQQEDLQKALEEAQAQQSRWSREAASAQREMEAEEAHQRQIQNEVLRLEEAVHHEEQQELRLHQALARAEAEAASLQERLRDRQQQETAHQVQKTREETAARDCRLQAETLLSGQAELLERSAGLNQEITARQTRIAALQAEQEATRARAADLLQLSQGLEQDGSRCQDLLETQHQRMETEQREIQRCAEQIKTLKTKLEELVERITTLQQEKRVLEAERVAGNRSSQEKNQELLDAQREIARLEQVLTESRMEERQVLDRLWERYELSHSQASALRMDLESPAKAGRQITKLKREMSDLGEVHLGAVQEFQRVNERYTYLCEQRDDVEKAQADLGRILREITEQMSEIFTQQFRLLADCFQRTFVELFGGGTAALELEDEADVLGCGIEIKAQPPGKSLRTLSLLSGGEKAFVAIALYFAILQIHPTPFCVMDEIEAALDDVNVKRCAHYLRRLSDRTQFIVITHRRGTMESADVLYGVTMEEQGVSKILRLNLGELASESPYTEP